MDAGKKLEEVLKQLEARDRQKNDVLLTKNDIRIDSITGNVNLRDIGPVKFTRTGFGQFCNWFGMPVRYAERCIERDPSMFYQHMKVWVNDAGESPILFRVHETSQAPTVRAVLTNQYGIIDDLPVFRQVADAAKEFEVAFNQFHFNEDFCDVRLNLPGMRRVVGKLGDGKTDDWIMPGFHVRNSETGRSLVVVSMTVHRLVCSNGMVSTKDVGQVVTRRHIGRNPQVDVGDKIAAVMGSMQGMFDQYADSIRRSKETQYTDIAKVLKATADRYGFTKAQRTQIEVAYAQEPGNTRHHVVQAITAAARDTNDWTDRLKLEGVASEVLMGAI